MSEVYLFKGPSKVLSNLSLGCKGWMGVKTEVEVFCTLEDGTFITLLLSCLLVLP